MRSSWLLLSVIVAMPALAVQALRPALDAPVATRVEAAFAEGHVLVAMRKHGARPEFAKSLAKAGARSLGSLPGLGIDVAAVVPGAEQAAVAKLRQDPNVEFAEVDRLMPAAATVNDPSYGSEWHLQRIHAPAAWDHTMGSGVVIAILDTGIDATHPDLAAQIVPGWNFYDNNADTSDVANHGTAVAGAAAAATNNGVGIAGVAGSAKLMPVRIASPSSYAYWSTAAQGIVYAADHGARVVNLSYEGAVGSASVLAAAQYLRSKGGVLIVAAGNTGAVDRTASTDLMLVVSATDESDQLASFSTYGDFVSLAAPGNNILSTLRGGNYVYWWGTSFATPIVAGAAALVLGQRPEFTPAQVEALLKATAIDLGDPGPDARFGAGRLDVGAALAFAAGPGVPDTTPPGVAITAPAGGTVAGIVAVTITASDDVGVVRVDLRADGVVVATSVVAPFQIAWNSSGVANGNVTLTAVARDASGNRATSAPVGVVVANAPPPDTTAPWATLHNLGLGPLTGDVVVTASAGDNVGVARVDFLVNGTTVATTNTVPYQFRWSTTTVPDGVVTLVAVAFDAAGNPGSSKPVQIGVSNPPPPPPAATGPPQPVTTPSPAPTPPPANGPAPQITAPAPTLPVTGPKVPTDAAAAPVVVFVTPGADAYITAGVPIAARVVTADTGTVVQSLYIDGKLRHTCTGPSLDYVWNARGAAPGRHTITLIATDAAGRVGTGFVQVLRK